MALAVHITAPPPYQPPQIVARGPFDHLDKRQQLTFSTCGLQCAAADFCQQYRTNFGFCCPRSVLTRTAFNYCGPATTCIEYGVSTGIADFFFDSTSSIQYCGSARPSCVTYVYRNDDFTQVFCASNESGTSFFETTSTRVQSATFVGGTSTTSSETTSEPTSATVVSRTSAGSGDPTNTSDPVNTSSTNPPTSSSTGSSSGLSSGAVAGIGVGAALAGIGAAIGGFFLWRRSNKKKKDLAGAPSGNQNFPPQPPMANHPQGFDNNNTGYYQHQQPYAQVPQGGHQAELSGAGVVGGQEYYKGTYPPPVSPGGVPQHPIQHQPNVYELGGPAQMPPQGGQSPYHENTAPHFRQELQG